MKKSLLVLLLVCTGLMVKNVTAQDANSFYFMRGVPQTYHVNPALQPEFDFFIGLPGLAPLKFNFKTPIGVSDVLMYDPTIDSTITFLHPNASKDEFLNALDDFSNFTTELSTSIASIGMKISEYSFLSFDIRQKALVDLGYSRDFFRLPMLGFDDGSVYDLEMDMTLSLYSEWSMGLSRKIGDKLTVGWRGKLLFGQANVHTKNFNINVATTEEQWDVGADIQVRASSPYLLDYVTEASQVPFSTAFADFDNIDIPTPTSTEIREMIFNPANFGMAMDLGVNLRLFDWLQLSASVVDFGSIKWDSMVSVDYNVEYVYNGVNGGNLEEGFQDVFTDSLKTTFDRVSTVKDKYRSTIPTKIYIGGAFYLHPYVSFGLLSRTDIYNSRLKQQFTASANLYPIRMFSTSLSYTLIQGKYSSYGIGVSLKLLPFNLYILTDIGPSLTRYHVSDDIPVDLPLDFRNINFKIGMNLAIGGPARGKKAKKQEYDLPLVD